MVDFHKCIEALSPQKRKLLSLRLNKQQNTAPVQSVPLRAGKRLVAYIVPVSKQHPKIGALRNFLIEKLPDYMVPSNFMFIDAMPLLPNGKVNRQELPAPDQLRPELEEAYVAPRTELEHLLARMWCEILGMEKVGIHDHFFELGGNSIQAAIFINKLQATLGESIHVAVLFRISKIADFATYLTEHHPNAVAKFVRTDNFESREDTNVPTLQPTSRNEAQLLAKLDQLSDQEVSSLLQNMLVEEEVNK
jgi:hypothetical protein